MSRLVEKVRFRHDGDLGVTDPREESAIERIIVAAIEKHARGDVEALARGIIEELRRWSGDPARSALAGVSRCPANHRLTALAAVTISRSQGSGSVSM
jgi:hypothetical protein